MVNVPKTLFSFCSQIKCWLSGLEFTKCLSEYTHFRVMFLMVKSMFYSQFQGENSHFKKIKSPFCDILTALHCVTANCIFQILKWWTKYLKFCFYMIIWCEFFPILYKMKPKFPKSGCRVMFPKCRVSAGLKFTLDILSKQPQFCSDIWIF